MTDTVSDEIWIAFSRAYGEALSANFKTDHPYPHEGVMRAALEAVAPALRAKGMREAATLLRNRIAGYGLNDATLTTLDNENAILARAAELEKQ